MSIYQSPASITKTSTTLPEAPTKMQQPKREVEKISKERCCRKLDFDPIIMMGDREIDGKTKMILYRQIHQS